MTSDYASFHRNPGNLFICLFAVPVFVAGTLLSAAPLFNGRILAALPPEQSEP